MKQKILTFLADRELLKLFIYQISVRRNFFPLMSVYFLMQPNTSLQQVGIFMGIWFFLQMFLELPSGYLADRWWHQNTLIVSKIVAISSVLFYILWGTILKEYAFVCFIIAATFQSLMFVSNSGTFSAFFYDFLENRWEEKKFTEILSKQRWNVSLISVGFILLLPFATNVLNFFPFVIAWITDIIGFIAIVSVKSIADKKSIEKQDAKSIWEIFWEAKSIGFLPVATFLWLIAGLQIGHGAFRSVYLLELGLPLVWIGSVMALSRLIRFILAQYIHILEEKFSMKQQFLIELLVFSGVYFLVALVQNVYVVSVLFALVIWYQWARNTLMEKYILSRYAKDKRYKATILSIRGLFNNIIAIVVSFGIWYAMNISYQLWFLILGCVSIVGLSVSYYYIFRKKSW